VIKVSINETYMREINSSIIPIFMELNDTRKSYKRKNVKVKPNTRLDHLHVIESFLSFVTNTLPESIVVPATDLFFKDHIISGKFNGILLWDGEPVIHIKSTKTLEDVVNLSYLFGVTLCKNEDEQNFTTCFFGDMIAIFLEDMTVSYFQKKDSVDDSLYVRSYQRFMHQLETVTLYMDTLNTEHMCLEQDVPKVMGGLFATKLHYDYEMDPQKTVQNLISLLEMMKNDDFNGVCRLLGICMKYKNGQLGYDEKQIHKLIHQYYELNDAVYHRFHPLKHRCKSYRK